MAGNEDRAVDPFDLGQDPELADVLRALARSIKLSIRTHVPATVVTYNPATQRAVVEVEHLQSVKVTDPMKMPTNLLVLKGAPPNAVATLAPFILQDIPVAWPRTAAGFITFPLVPGDEGELHVSDRSLAAWLLTGGPVDPQVAFTHALADSAFHPGLHSTPKNMGPTDMTATVIEGASIKIGKDAAMAIAVAEKLIAVLDGAWGAATPTANDGGANLKATWIAYWNAHKTELKALKGKVE